MNEFYPVPNAPLTLELILAHVIRYVFLEWPGSKDRFHVPGEVVSTSPNALHKDRDLPSGHVVVRTRQYMGEGVSEDWQQAVDAATLLPFCSDVSSLAFHVSRGVGLMSNLT
jgi:hypothetical protein